MASNVCRGLEGGYSLAYLVGGGGGCWKELPAGGKQGTMSRHEIQMRLSGNSNNSALADARRLPQCAKHYTLAEQLFFCKASAILTCVCWIELSLSVGGARRGRGGSRNNRFLTTKAFAASHGSTQEYTRVTTTTPTGVALPYRGSGATF